MLEPFFKCVSIRYPHFKRFGPIKLFSDPYLIAISLFCVGALWLYGLIRPLQALVYFIGAIVAGYPIAMWRLRSALNDVRRQLDTELSAGDRPHLIAHSLGTYLFGTILKRWQGTRFDRIILVGCVLSKKYDWEGHLRRNPNSFASVRNEVAGKDWVSRAAFWLQGLIPSLGHAGFVGFKGSVSFVHNVPSPNLACPVCTPNPGVAAVHNVIHTDMGHNDYFIGANHAEAFWLPVLWGIEPGEYQDFLKLCSTIQKSIGNGESAIQYITELKTRKWRWLGGKSLGACIEARIREKLKNGYLRQVPSEADRLVGDALQQIWKRVEKAKDTRRKGSRSMKQLAALYPRWALALSIESVLKGVR